MGMIETGGTRDAGGVDSHFVELRQMIWAKVRELRGEAELLDYPDWLYGALGNPWADVMFVCASPSPASVEWTEEHVGDLGIEAQWRGDRTYLFRWVLCHTDLKLGEPEQRGGWR